MERMGDVKVTGRWLATLVGFGAVPVLALAAFMIIKREFVLDDAYRQREEPRVLEAVFRRGVTDEPNPYSDVYYLSYKSNPGGIERDPSEELLSRLIGLEACYKREDSEEKWAVNLLPAGKCPNKIPDSPQRREEWGPYCRVTILKWISTREVEFEVAISGGPLAASGFHGTVKKSLFGKWEVDPDSIKNRWLS